jgi:hypothetical protein
MIKSKAVVAFYDEEDDVSHKGSNWSLCCLALRSHGISFQQGGVKFPNVKQRCD